MSTEWWEAETEIDATPGPPAVRKPKELDSVDKYRMPATITAGWVEKQLTKGEWAQIKRAHPKLTLNPHVIENMARDAKKGLSKRSIMARAGLSVATWAAWEHKAAQGEQPYLLWYQSMMYSISSVEENLIENIKLAGMADWKASKWLLEQLNKDEYSPTPKNQIVNVAGDVKTENNTNSINYMSDEKALEVAQLLQTFGVVPQIENVVEGEVVDEDHDQN